MVPGVSRLGQTCRLLFAFTNKAGAAHVRLGQKQRHKGTATARGRAHALVLAVATALCPSASGKRLTGVLVGSLPAAMILSMRKLAISTGTGTGTDTDERGGARPHSRATTEGGGSRGRCGDGVR